MQGLLGRRGVSRWLTLTALGGLTLLVVLATSSGAARAPQGVAAKRLVRTPHFDTLLVKQLRRSSSGKVAAVVTTWNRRDLRRVERLGVRGKKLRVLPMLLTRSLTSAQLTALRRAPFVRSVWSNRKHALRMEDTTWITRARYAWEGRDIAAGAGASGLLPSITGKGVEIAEIDTGVDAHHEDADNLIEFCETLGAVTASASEALCSPAPPPTLGCSGGPAGPFNNARRDSQDDDGHGTHVMGTIAGTGEASGGRANNHSTIGMAPEASTRVYSANVGPALANFEILAAYDDMTCKKEKGYTRVVAVSNSWGGGDGSNYDPSDPTNVAIKRAYDAGILSVFAAGNSGPEHDTLSSECVNPYVVCVAASTKPDAVVMFSSRGRPSEPTDTNRNGRVGQPGAAPTIPDGPDPGTDPDPNPSFDPGDTPPDNHDRRLAQALELGLYRPTITAPGVNIFSMNQEAATTTCSEDNGPSLGDPASAASRDCYVALNGTSMATPHVSGAVALIVQAYRGSHAGATPSPAVITDILERSANVRKLPGYEAEEQGAGRLDALEAVKAARAYGSFSNPYKKPNLGTPTPPYEAGASPFETANVGATPLPSGAAYTEKGCTGPLSWTTSGIANPVDFPVEPPPTATLPTYGQHFINVPTRVERLRVTVSWPRHRATNLYVRLWRPGVNPDAETAPPGPTRVFPDQEAVGLLTPESLPFLGPSRFLDIRAPEEANAAERAPGLSLTLPPGRWILRIYHRLGGTPTTCDADSSENPKQTLGYNYTVKVEEPRSTQYPSVAITSPGPTAGLGTGRFQEFQGTATYPNPWEGVTNWEVPGTAGGSAGGGGEPDPDTRTVLYMHGNPHASEEPQEADCTGDGRTDVEACGGPLLIEDPDLFEGTAASWKLISPLLDDRSDESLVDPNWVWCLADEEGPRCAAVPAGTRRGPTTIEGPMTVQWWATTFPAGQTPGLFTMGWTIRVFADGALKFESSRIEQTPAVAGLPSRLKAVVNLPRIHAERRIVVHVDANELDVDEELTTVYYDSDAPCPGSTSTEPCDSLIKMPVIPEGTPENRPTGVPANVRVTDTHNGLRVAWDPVEGAGSYAIYRSTSPTFAVTPTSAPYATTAGASCTSPNPGAPYPQGWPANVNGSRPGRCFTDTAVTTLTTYYYRVVAITNGVRSNPSGLAYGTPTLYDRQVKLKVDRVFGPQYWDFATLLREDGTSWRYLWDRLELNLGDPHNVFARSFTQGIGSAKFRFGDQPPAGPAPPQDPVVTLVKTGPATASRGETITYTISYKNLGPKDASSARIVDTLPSGVSYVSSSPSGSYSSFTRKVTWNLGTVPAGAEGSVTLRVRISTSASGTIVNKADFIAPQTVSPPTATWATAIT